ncbi:MAG TPA: LCP family protein [Alphaproteobacteria bacterium]|jgi:LCP family protein required for cell wall assembly|nr:LCP family protein [Alphaproteobacteria bacterium]
MSFKKIVLVIILLILFVIGFWSWKFYRTNIGQVNILILGTGGENHTAGDLTDVMMVASVSPGRVNVISLPRDLWIPEIRAKINTAYHYGGIDLTKTSVEKVLDLPINHYVLLDFSGFTKIIDVLGGIEVQVDNEFEDKLYPIAGRENDPCIACRYEVVEFKKGLQVMNGETALKFVRSRHATGDEGTDTARSSRQQKVIDAIKNKILSPKVILNPKQIQALYKVFKNSVQTDIDNKIGITLVKEIFKARNNVLGYLIPESLLVNPPISKIYDKQYVFVPHLGNGKWEEIHEWVKSLPSQTY